jgi:uncharacterized protein YneF (UPF0154 family)
MLILAGMSVGWQCALWCIGGIIIGGIIGFFVARSYFAKQIKKNPPINEKMIRAMFLSMGRKPSEARIKQVMASVKSSR